MLFENAFRLFDGRMRADIIRILMKGASLEDDTFHHVRRVRHTIFVDCLANCVVAHAGVGNSGNGKSIVKYQVGF